MKKLVNVEQAAQWRLCIGCGACTIGCPHGKVSLENIANDGIRPRIKDGDCDACGQCLEVCPGYSTVHAPFHRQPGLIRQLIKGWGPVLELWEGFAADEEIRFCGSSGGLATALGLYCIEKEQMYAVLHIGADSQKPWENVTTLSRRRQDLLDRTGSRYAPASPCDGLSQIRQAPAPCVFMGKPCDVAGLRKVQSADTALSENVGAAIGIFCAGTPNTQGTLALIERLGARPGSVAEVRYRGKGWPGVAAIRLKGRENLCRTQSYEQSWGFLQKFRPYRCHLCPDGTSEFADIACGDPWYRPIAAGDPGHSLAVVRTERGRQLIRGAMAAGYVHLTPATADILERSQPNLLGKRRAIWGRLLAMRAFGLPIPQLDGFSLYENWRELPLREKLRSILGTARRIVQRRYDKRFCY